MMDLSRYKTYAINAPLSSHFRAASCEEVGCPNFLNGWKIHKEALSPQLLHTATHSGRKYSEAQVSEGQTYLIFDAGQSCFQVLDHRTRVERPEIYTVRDGRSAKRVHARPEHWVEDLHEHTDKLAEARKEG